MSETRVATAGAPISGAVLQGRDAPGTRASETGVEESMLTRSEAARILGVSPTTVTRWAREGRLACRVTLGGHHRFSRALIEEIRSRMSRG